VLEILKEIFLNSMTIPRTIKAIRPRQKEIKAGSRGINLTKTAALLIKSTEKLSSAMFFMKLLFMCVILNIF
jgi:hypothetical protein